MTSAVLDRVLAIPDYDLDRPQMGLSRSGLAAIVERGGITKDGTKAKSSVLERAGIKGDRKLPSKPVNKFEEKLRDEVATTAKYIKTRTNDPRLIQNAIDNTKAIVIDKLVPKIRAGNQKILNPLKKKRAIGAYKGGDIIRRKKRAMTDRDIARNAGIKSAKLESQGQLNLFNQPKQSASAAKIAPDTAKKVKRAIAGVKGGSQSLKKYKEKELGKQKQRMEKINGKSYVKNNFDKQGKAIFDPNDYVAGYPKPKGYDSTVKDKIKSKIIGSSKRLALKANIKPKGAYGRKTIRRAKRPITQRDIRLELERKGQIPLFDQSKMSNKKQSNKNSFIKIPKVKKKSEPKQRFDMRITSPLFFL